MATFAILPPCFWIPVPPTSACWGLNSSLCMTVLLRVSPGTAAARRWRRGYRRRAARERLHRAAVRSADSGGAAVWVGLLEAFAHVSHPTRRLLRMADK